MKMSSQRYQFDAWCAEITAAPPENMQDGPNLVISFNAYEDFAAIVKRLAKSQSDAQIKLAYSALENEMGRRIH